LPRTSCPAGPTWFYRRHQQKDIESIREVIRQLRAALPKWRSSWPPGLLVRPTLATRRNWRRPH
jgi:hypothetical protein